jgi:two-component system phosphate regulon response regulator OmpR
MLLVMAAGASPSAASTIATIPPATLPYMTDTWPRSWSPMTADLRALLQRYLSDQGYTVHGGGAGPLDVLLARERDVLVLDVMMPGRRLSIGACARRARPFHPDSPPGRPVDRIIGLEMGADDYLPKPFNPRELLARIQALVRRQRLLGAHTAPQAGGDVLRFGDCTLHLAARRLSAPNEIPGTGEFARRRWHATPHRPLGRDRPPPWLARATAPQTASTCR